MRVRKREACSESCGNNLITRTLAHHARSKRSEINSTVYTYAFSLHFEHECVRVYNYIYLRST